MARMEPTELTMIGGPCDGETRTMTDTAMIAVGHKVENDSSDRGYDVHRYVVTESGGSRVLTYAGIEPPILVDNDV